LPSYGYGALGTMGTVRFGSHLAFNLHLMHQQLALVETITPGLDARVVAFNEAGQHGTPVSKVEYLFDCHTEHCL